MLILELLKVLSINEQLLEYEKLTPNEPYRPNVLL